MPKGIKGFQKGYKITEKHRENLKKSLIGHLVSKKTKDKIRQSNLGKKRSEETKRKISESKKGNRNPKVWLGKKFSQEHKKKLSISHIGQKSYWKGKENPNLRGNKNPNWKGGISRGYKTGYDSLKYRLWREAVFQRDKYTCQNCGFKGNNGYITAHHIKSWAKYSELRFNIDNGITLCEECHSRTDNYKGRGKI